MKKFKKVYIEITNNCNLLCNFCIKNSRKSKFITNDEFKTILEKIKPYTDYLYFHLLGEPLLHPKINEFIDYASNDFKINITTNGYLINRIKNNFNIRQLNISLHSFDIKYGVSLGEYMKTVLEVSNMLADKGTYISFRFWVDSPYTNDILNKINSYFNSKIKLEDISTNIMIKKNIFINKSHLFEWPDNSTYNLENGKFYGLIDHIGILSDGTIVPCCLDANGKINLGNIYKDNIKCVLNSNRVNNIINGFKNNKKYEELCRKCHFLP